RILLCFYEMLSKHDVFCVNADSGLLHVFLIGSLVFVVQSLLVSLYSVEQGRLLWFLVKWNEVSTIFSYAAPVFTNEFQLRGQVDMRERILLALIIHGKHLPYKASFPNDGAWHHICVTWRRSSSHWAIYVDGDRKDTGSGTDTSRDIHGDGIFILGQDQDSFGGNFTEPFFGTITDLNVWNMSLDTRHVTALKACSPMTHDVLFSWNMDLLSCHPVVKEVQALLFCPGKITFLYFTMDNWQKASSKAHQNI
uniref:Pentraxin (PTX) domain-containing protein n=1 Tax=Seriola lalandi dorsalis TaxID=1841481 RepID=A0A3B4X4W6_SERLL